MEKGTNGKIFETVKLPPANRSTDNINEKKNIVHGMTSDENPTSTQFVILRSRPMGIWPVMSPLANLTSYILRKHDLANLINLSRMIYITPLILQKYETIKF